MVYYIGVKVISERIVKQGGVSEVFETGQEVIKIQWQVGVDVIEAHYVLQSEHDRQEGPAKS